MTAAGVGGASPARREAWGRLCRLNRATGPAARGDQGHLDRRERAQADRLVRGVLQHVTALDALIDTAAQVDRTRTDGAVIWILRLAAYEQIHQADAPDYAIGQQAVALAREAAGGDARKAAAQARFVNAVVRRMLRELPPDAAAAEATLNRRGVAEDVRLSIPSPICAAYREAYGPAAPDVLEALSHGETATWLRVNTLRADPAAVRAGLAEEGVPTETDAGLAEALRWTGGDRLPWETDTWRRAEITVQDAAAMLTTHVLDPRPGMRVLDLCAAPGGKTGHVWERMRGEGSLTAVEVDAARRATLRSTLARLYGVEAGVDVPDVDDLDRFNPAAPFERVLIDAPCLSLGLIRRHPEIRWENRTARLHAMTRTQQAILRAGARRVAAGGRLLWVTCSPTRAENEAVVEELVGAGGWRVLEPSANLPDAVLAWVDEWEGVLRTRPDRLPCDAFAMLLLERTG